MSDWKKRILFVPAVGLGVLMLLALRGCGDPPAERPPSERAAAVRVIEIPASGIDLVPRAVGYGTVAARTHWSAISQVGGRIVELNPRLRVGAFVEAGATLARVDAADYEIASARALAAVAVLDAQLDQSEEKERQLERQLALEERSLELVRNELTRISDLVAQGIDPATSRDAQEREVLRQENAVQSVRDGLALLPAQRAELTANRAAQQASLTGARLDIERCTLTAPFALRVTGLSAEQEQVVGVGQVFCTGEGVDVAEVAAQFSPGRLGPVLAGGEQREVGLPTEADLGEVLQLSATVHLREGGLDVSYPARVVRAEAIRSDTRTVPVVVAVEKPYEGVIPGVRPPLATGLYVEVELRGGKRSGQVVVPRSAVHEGQRIYVADAQDRLRFRPAKIVLEQGSIASVAVALERGDRVVVSDVVPAVDGMLLAPTLDAETWARVQAEARGAETVR